MHSQHLIPLMVVDSQKLMREGLGCMIDTSVFNIVTDVSTGSEALTAFQKHKPEVVLMEVNLSDMSGLEVARRMLDQNPECKVLLMSAATTEGDLLHALNLNVKGFLLKGNNGSENLNQTLRLVAGGESVFPSTILKNSMRRASDGSRLHGLTRRESEILRYLAQGESNKSIARILDLSEGTVKVHVKAILKKLNMQNRTQAAIFAHERGIGTRA